MMANEPGDPELEANFKMLAGIVEGGESCREVHGEEVYCDNCKPPQSWFEAMKSREMPDEIMVKTNSTHPTTTEINRRVQLVVLRNDGTYRYYPMNKYPGGWHIDTTYRTLIIGKGMGRRIIPLETIDYFSPEEY